MQVLSPSFAIHSRTHRSSHIIITHLIAHRSSLSLIIHSSPINTDSTLSTRHSLILSYHLSLTYRLTNPSSHNFVDHFHSSFTHYTYHQSTSTHSTLLHSRLCTQHSTLINHRSITLTQYHALLAHHSPLITRLSSLISFLPIITHSSH
jgi:hypothetical protein